MVESSVKLVTVFALTALDVDVALILNGVSGYLSDNLRVAGLHDLLASNGLNDLLGRIDLINAGVAVDFHLQLDHTAEVGRYHEVCAVLLREFGGFDSIDA